MSGYSRHFISLHNNWPWVTRFLTVPKKKGITVFTLNIQIPQLITLLVLTFEQVHLTPRAHLFKANDDVS